MNSHLMLSKALLKSILKHILAGPLERWKPWIKSWDIVCNSTRNEWRLVRANNFPHNRLQPSSNHLGDDLIKLIGQGDRSKISGSGSHFHLRDESYESILTCFSNFPLVKKSLIALQISSPIIGQRTLKKWASKPSGPGEFYLLNRDGLAQLRNVMIIQFSRNLNVLKTARLLFQQVLSSKDPSKVVNNNRFNLIWSTIGNSFIVSNGMNVRSFSWILSRSRNT